MISSVSLAHQRPMDQFFKELPKNIYAIFSNMDYNILKCTFIIIINKLLYNLVNTVCNRLLETLYNLTNIKDI